MADQYLIKKDSIDEIVYTVKAITRTHAQFTLSELTASLHTLVPRDPSFLVDYKRALYKYVPDTGFYACIGPQDDTKILVTDKLFGLSTYIPENAFQNYPDLTEIYLSWTEYDYRNEHLPWGAVNAVIRYKDNSTKGLSYILSNDKTHYICSGIGTATDTNIVIASEVDGYPVTEISDDAFYGNSRITSVTIPSSVSKVGSFVFADCPSIQYMIIPSISIIDPNESYFSYLFGAYGSSDIGFVPERLKTVQIVSGTVIPTRFFYRLSSIENILLPKNLTTIESYAFEQCSSLKSISIPNEVLSIGGNAFYKCSNLKTLTVPDKVTTIESYAFGDCSKLSQIWLGSGLTNLNKYAFGRDFAVTDIYCNWVKGEKPSIESEAPWGAVNAAIHYNSEV